jgi:hypothetical protein
MRNIWAWKALTPHLASLAMISSCGPPERVPSGLRFPRKKKASGSSGPERNAGPPPLYFR